MLIAAALTVVILVGYGGYTAWNALFGGNGGSSSSEATGAVTYEDAIGRSLYIAYGVVQSGVDTHLVVDLGPFLAATNGAVLDVAAQKAALEKLVPTTTGARLDVLNSSMQGLDDLANALVMWRDALFNVRLASVDDARSAIDAAVARLQADLERWESLPA